MRKGFTIIPNSLLDQPWANNPTVVYLYIWLSLNADTDGRISISLNKAVELTGLSKKQVRNSLDKLVRAQFVTQSRAQKGAQKGAHAPSALTICNPSSCKCEKQDEGTTKGTVEGTQKERGLFPLDEETPPIPPKEVKPLLSPKENPSHKRARKAFVKPTVEEVEEYIRQKGYNIDAEYFWNFYETNGWVQGREQKPIKNWKSCVTTWVRKQYNHATTPNPQQPYHDSDHPTTEQLRQQTAAYIASRLAQD